MKPIWIVGIIFLLAKFVDSFEYTQIGKQPAMLLNKVDGVRTVLGNRNYIAITSKGGAVILWILRTVNAIPKDRTSLNRVECVKTSACSGFSIIP